MIDLPKIICRYSDRFHRSGGNLHRAASPLGAWLLLALSSRAASGGQRGELTDILGVDPGTAASWADRMLQAPHRAVACATAVWARAGRDAECLAPFLASLPSPVARGTGIPPRSELDAWAREHTQGLIPSFPLSPDPRSSLLLANALATKVRWLTPFETTPASELGARSEWSRALDRVLRTSDEKHHVGFIARTAKAGDVAVHSVWSDDDLRVTSVIAPPDIPPRDVLAVAHEIATRLVAGKVDRLSLYELPLGETSIWRLRQREIPTYRPDERAESYSALLPAWEAHTDHDLLGRELGFEHAAQVLAQIAGLPLEDVEAKQSAMARYTRLGFEAAAVTAMRVYLGCLPPDTCGVERHVELRFGHPFAVVATTWDQKWNDAAGGLLPGPWNGVPVFSAWVAAPMDSIAEERRGGGLRMGRGAHGSDAGGERGAVEERPVRRPIGSGGAGAPPTSRC